MKIFSNPELTEEIKVINFGIVKAGETKELTLYLYNDSKALLTNLTFEFGPLPEPNLKVLEAPVTIQPHESQVLKLRWSPTLTFRQPLEVNLLILGEEIFLSKVILNA